MGELTTMLKRGGPNVQMREWSIERSTLAKEIEAAKKLATEKGMKDAATTQNIPSQTTKNPAEKNSRRTMPAANCCLAIVSCPRSSAVGKTAPASLPETTSLRIRKEASASI